MGSRVNVCSVNFLDNPATFKNDFRLEITFEVFENLPHDLEWELVYVGSGESQEYDQILDSVLVGPTPEGKHQFVFTANAPDADKIPQQDIVGVTVLLVKCRYNNQEFLNLGWYVSNEYTDEKLKEEPPVKPIIDQLTRTVQTDDLRVTSFPIKWDDGQAEADDVAPQEDDQVEEADLMPLESDGEKDEEEKEDELDGGDAAVDLDDEENEDEEEEMEGAADETDSAADDVMEQTNDVDMEENTVEPVTATDAGSSGDAKNVESKEMLGDVTNGATSA